MNIYGFVSNNGVNAWDVLGFAVWIVDASGEFDPAGGGLVRITKQQKARVDNFLQRFDQIPVAEFPKLVEAKVVKFNGEVFSGTHTEYRRLVEREKESSVVGVGEGGAKAVGKKLTFFDENKAKEAHDELGLVAHGTYGGSNSNPIPTNNVVLAGEEVTFKDVFTALQSFNTRVIWASCFRTGPFCEGMQIKSPSGAVLWRSDRKPSECKIEFVPFKINRIIEDEPGIPTSDDN